MRLKGSEGEGYVRYLGEVEVPEVEVCLVNSRYSKKGNVTGTECVRGNMIVDKIREQIMGSIHVESCLGLWILFWRPGQSLLVLNRGVTFGIVL